MLDFFLFFFFILTQGQFFIVFIERGGTEEGREKHQCETEALIGCLPYVPRPGILHAYTGTEPAT